MCQNGKGDVYRPYDPRKWDEGYKRAFGSDQTSNINLGSIGYASNTDNTGSVIPMQS